MAERKAGPVKPPVIDLTARPAEPAKPAEGAEGAPKPAESPEASEAPKAAPAADSPGKSGPSGAAKSPPGTAANASNPTGSKAKPELGRTEEATAPKPSAPPRPWGPAVAMGIGGAVLAAVICYGLAEAGYWPSASGRQLAALDQRLTQAEQADAAAGDKLADLNTRLDALQKDSAAKLAAADATLAGMQSSLKTLQAPAADLASVQDQVKALTTRLDAVAAGASSADAGALAANIATVRQSLAALAQKVEALTARAGANDATVAGLKSDLASAKTAIDKAAAAPSAQQIAATMQLPILISALDAGFSAGRPYRDDLNALQAALPGLDVPPGVGGAATTGLPAPAAVVADFEAKMPDVMAAEPDSSGSGWQGQITDWARSVLALRRQGAETGSGPDALLSQLEAAVVRHDFAGAAALLDKLPQPMQQAAGDAGQQVRTLAEAEAFIGALRQRALKPATGAAS
jgi:predicted  nucleic acid-binding Zn-ribbon protein